MDATLAAYLAELPRPGPGAGERGDGGGPGRARLASEPSPAGERTARVLAGYRGMRRSEVSALRWADVDDAADGDGVLVTVRRGKTNQEGETRDVRFVKQAPTPARGHARTSPIRAERVPDESLLQHHLHFMVAPASPACYSFTSTTCLGMPSSHDQRKRSVS